MGDNEVTERLRQKAATDKMAADVFHVFAARGRARKVVTIRALFRRMAREGFQYKQPDLAPVLEFLAGLGLGRLGKDGKGRVIDLHAIPVTLQSIGMAAIGDGAALKRVRNRGRYGKLVAVPATKAPVPTPPVIQRAPEKVGTPAQPVEAKRPGLVFTVVLRSGRRVNLGMATDYSPEEIADLVDSFVVRR